MYYIYGISGPSLLIESTDSMIDFVYKKGLNRIQVATVMCILLICDQISENPA